MPGGRLTFPLVPRRGVIGISFGTMRSLRRGTGTDIAGSRPYRPGDDMDAIDWAASARLSTARARDEFVVRERFAYPRQTAAALEKALGKKGDVALGITTSGSSGNVLKALRAAKKLGMTTIALSGEGGKAASLSDIALQIPSRSTPRIQEAHIAVGHILCDLTDTILFKDVGKR